MTTIEQYIRSKIDFDGLGSRLQSLDRKLSYVAADGSNPGFPAYPAAGGDDIADVGLTAIGAHLSLASRTHVILADRRFTADGKNHELDPHRGAVLSVMALAGDQLKKHKIDVEKRDRELYAPAQIERGDFESALADREIREYVRTLKGKELEQARAAMVSRSTDAQRMIVAFMRSPIPMGENESFVRRAWNDFVAESRPAEVARLTQQKASLDWATLVTGQLAHQVMKLSAWGAPRIYEHTRQTGGWNIFGFSPTEAAGWQMVIDQRAASKSEEAA